MERKRDTIYYSSNNNNKHEFGTGFIVTGRMRNFTVDFKAVNERICVLRLKGRFHNYSMINVHAPTEEKEEYIKDQFYNILEKTYEECPKFDIKICLGDFKDCKGDRS